MASETLEALSTERAALRGIVLGALKIAPELQAAFPLISGAEMLADGYALAMEKTEDQRRVIESLESSLASERATNAAHVHARRMGLWISLLAMVISCIAGLGIGSFLQRGLGK